jgi:hypothetical protein
MKVIGFGSFMSPVSTLSIRNPAPHERIKPYNVLGSIAVVRKVRPEPIPISRMRPVAAEITRC